MPIPLQGKQAPTGRVRSCQLVRQVEIPGLDDLFKEGGNDLGASVRGALQLERSGRGRDLQQAVHQGKPVVVHGNGKRVQASDVPEAGIGLIDPSPVRALALFQQIDQP